MSLSDARRPTRGRSAGAAAAACALLAVLAGCNDTRDLAPPDPSSPWRPVVRADDGAMVPATGERAAGARSAVNAPGAARVFRPPGDPALPFDDPHPAIDPAHSYSLVELVDVAERNSKQTRIAWEQARQAAIGVGISRAAFLPMLTLSALGGFRRETTPEQNSQGYITSDAVAAFPALAISYLLVDFGARDAAARAARQLSEASNASFTQAHQQLILSVARAFFSLAAADAELAAAERALDNARLLSDAAGSRLQHGEGTVTDNDDATRDVAQARFSIATARADRDTDRDTLLEVLGLPPRTALRVEPLDARPVPRAMGADLDLLMRDALGARPDLLADLARLRASEADTARARAALYPQISLNVKASGDVGRIAIENGPSETFIQPETGIYLAFEWPFYQGGLKANQLRQAESRQQESRDVLEQAEDQAMREVAVAYDELQAGLSQYDAAVALRQAAGTAFSSGADAFRHGVGTITQADSAETALNQADATLARAHAQVLASAATLAFATGQLGSAASLPP